MNNEFEYQMIGRLVSDINYYLGYGNRNPKNLWALNEKDQIDKLRELWNIVEVKPDWLTLEQIDEYERLIVNGSES